MRLLFVTVALGLSATASAWGHVGGAAPARRQFGWEEGNKCVSSSETITMDQGACGKVKMRANGVCAASQKSVDDGMKAMSALMEAFGDSADTSGLLTASDCKSQGEDVAEQYCAGASSMLGETVKVKAQDMCDMYCSIIKDSSTAPQDCMSDSDCPDGVDIMPCCQFVLDMTKRMCEYTDAQLAKADLKVMAAAGICTNDETKCYSAAGRYSASTVFALATGMLAMLMSSHN